jgi:hypothetical protein
VHAELLPVPELLHGRKPIADHDRMAGQLEVLLPAPGSRSELLVLGATQ